MNLKQVLSLIISFHLIMNNMLLAKSIEVDKNASSKYKASLIKAPNGITIVNT